MEETWEEGDLSLGFYRVDGKPMTLDEAGRFLDVVIGVAEGLGLYVGGGISPFGPRGGKRPLWRRADEKLRVEAKQLREAGEFALEHVEELEKAWSRGIIEERDHLGGTRSNRNIAARVRLSEALE